MPIIEGARQRQPAVQKSGAPVAGDFNGQVEKGDMCLNTASNTLYVNTGTRAATTWAVVGGQVGP